MGRYRDSANTCRSRYRETFLFTQPTKSRRINTSTCVCVYEYGEGSYSFHLNSNRPRIINYRFPAATAAPGSTLTFSYKYCVTPVYGVRATPSDTPPNILQRFPRKFLFFRTSCVHTNVIILHPHGVCLGRTIPLRSRLRGRSGKPWRVGQDER